MAWRAASRPNADPRSCSGASRATAAVSAVSAAADPDAGEDETDGEQREAFAGVREAEVGDQKARDADGEDSEESVAVADVAGWDAGECGGEVVGGVEHERELGCGGVRSTGLQEFGGAEDEQRRGEVPALKRGRGGE